MTNDLPEIDVVFEADAIAERIESLAAEVAGKLPDDVLIVVVLKGSFVFTADLARAIDANVQVEFLGVQSYGEGTTSSGVVQITHDLTRSIEDEHVLIVEDIVDTGLTLSHLLDLLRTRKPASLKVASLLHKPARTKVDIEIDYLGFTIEDVFVIGYGLDYAQKYRNLPYIGVLEQ